MDQLTVNNEGVIGRPAVFLPTNPENGIGKRSVSADSIKCQKCGGSDSRLATNGEGELVCFHCFRVPRPVPVEVTWREILYSHRFVIGIGIVGLAVLIAGLVYSPK